MAKKKESALDAEIKQSIGSMMKGKMSQRDRNLAVKAELIKKGLHPEPKFEHGTTQKERNLLLKEKLYGKEKGQAGAAKKSGK